MQMIRKKKIFVFKKGRSGDGVKLLIRRYQGVRNLFRWNYRHYDFADGFSPGIIPRGLPGIFPAMHRLVKFWYVPMIKT